MEWKIGEIFEYKGEWYQCIEGISCKECDFSNKNIICNVYNEIACTRNSRTDNKSVIFKKLEKVGEPIIYMSRTFQRLKSPDAEQCKYCYFGNQVCNPQLCGKQSFLVEIKTKEDMEEKKIQHYDCFFDKEQSKPNLKPFSLEAAKQGKPVCTRDGRKARIICFDRKLTYKNVSYPILALVKRDGEDDVCCYNEKGKVLVEDDLTYKDDLMMLPKKKEGWVNLWRHESGTVHPDGNIYSSKEEAAKIGSRDYNYIDTVKIEWEE